MVWKGKLIWSSVGIAKAARLFASHVDKHPQPHMADSLHGMSCRAEKSTASLKLLLAVARGVPVLDAKKWLNHCKSVYKETRNQLDVLLLLVVVVMVSAGP
jgi:hypothetical protein